MLTYSREGDTDWGQGYILQIYVQFLLRRLKSVVKITNIKDKTLACSEIVI